MSQNHLITEKESFQHLTLEERREIQTHYASGISMRKIATLLGRSVSSISEEIKRGTVLQKLSNGNEVYRYFPDVGQRVYEENRQNCVTKGIERYSQKFLSELSDVLLVRPRIHSVDSFRNTYIAEAKEVIPSVRTLYRLIDQGLLAIKNIDLPQKTKRQARNQPSRPKGTNLKRLGRSISERPNAVLNREEVGHWEGDLVKGSKQKGEPALLTLVERATRFALIFKVPNFESTTCLEAVRTLLFEHGLSMFKSITFDNGSEFSRMSELETLGDSIHDLKIYYAHAYSSWERGSNENFNGLLREFVPKGVSIHHLTEEQILSFESALNNRPRKILGYQTAEEAFDATA